MYSLTKQNITDKYIHIEIHNHTKSILIVHPDNLKSGELFGTHHGFAVCTGPHYIGGYIGDDESKGGCLKKWMEK